ncbi:MAG: LamG-like jellyroll fold domain-containing protein [Bacteroidota bacterium]
MRNRTTTWLKGLFVVALFSIAFSPRAHAQTPAVPTTWLGPDLISTDGWTEKPATWNHELRDTEGDVIRTLTRGGFFDQLINGEVMDSGDFDPPVGPKGLLRTGCKSIRVGIPWLIGFVSQDAWNCSEVEFEVVSEVFMPVPGKDQLGWRMDMRNAGRWALDLQVVGDGGAVIHQERINDIERVTATETWSQIEVPFGQDNLKRVWYWKFNDDTGAGDQTWTADLSDYHHMPVRFVLTYQSKLGRHYTQGERGTGDPPDPARRKYDNRQSLAVFGVGRLLSVSGLHAYDRKAHRPGQAVLDFEAAEPVGGWQLPRATQAERFWSGAYATHMLKLNGGASVRSPLLAPSSIRDDFYFRVGNANGTDADANGVNIQVIPYTMVNGVPTPGTAVNALTLNGPITPHVGAMRYHRLDLSAYQGQMVQVVVTATGSEAIYLDDFSGIDPANYTVASEPGLAWVGDGAQVYELGQHANFGITGGSFAIEGWFKFDNPMQQQTLIGDNGPGSLRQLLHIELRNGRPHFGFYADDLHSSETLQANRWYHLAFTYNHAENRQYIYVDGLERGERVAGGPLAAPSGSSLFIGQSGLGVTPMRGQVDELRIWRKHLTGDEVAVLGKRNLSRSESGLVGYYTFDTYYPELSYVGYGVGAPVMPGFRNLAGDQLENLWQTQSHTVVSRPANPTGAPLGTPAVPSTIPRAGDVTVAGPGQVANAGDPGARMVVTPTGGAGVSVVTVTGKLSDPMVLNTQETLPAGVGARTPLVFSVQYTAGNQPNLVLEYGAMGFHSDPVLLFRNPLNNDNSWDPVDIANSDVSHNTGADTFSIPSTYGVGTPGVEYTLGTGVTTDLAIELRPWAYNREERGSMNRQWQNETGQTVTVPVAKYDVLMRNLGGVNSPNVWYEILPQVGSRLTAKNNFPVAANTTRYIHSVNPSGTLIYFNPSNPYGETNGQTYALLTDANRTHYPMRVQFGNFEGVTDSNPANNSFETPLVVAGLSEYSAYFNGQNSGLETGVPTGELFGTSGDWQVNFWVKLPKDTPATGDQVILSHGYHVFKLGLLDRKPYVQLTNNGTHTYTANHALTPGAWHHIEVLHNDTNNIIVIAVDGAEVLERRDTAMMDTRFYNDPNWLTRTPFIGLQDNGPGPQASFKGHLDELMFTSGYRIDSPYGRWARGYTSRHTINGSGMTTNAHYRFEAGAGPWVIDFSGFRQTVSGNLTGDRTRYLYNSGTAFTWSTEHAPVWDNVAQTTGGSHPSVTLTNGSSQAVVNVIEPGTSGNSHIVGANGTPGTVRAATALAAQGETLPSGIISRGDVQYWVQHQQSFWGAQNNRLAQYNFSYGDTGIATSEARLLYRRAPGSTWTDITDRTEVVNDAANRYFNLNGNYHFMQANYPTGEYAIGRRVSSDVSLAVTLGVNEMQVTAANAGPAEATGGVVAITLPQGIGLAEAVLPNGAGTFNAETRRWTLPTLASSASQTLTLRLTGITGTSSVTAEVVALQSFDSDSTPGDGQGDDYATATLVQRVAGAGSALAFDGDDYVTTGATVGNLGLTNASFTVEAWVYPTQHNNHHPILSVFDFTGSPNNEGFHLVLQGGKVLFAFFANDVTSTSTLPLNRWTHIAATYTYDAGAGNGTQRIFLNGVQDAERTGALPLLGNRGLEIGRYNRQTHFNGQIDELRVWNAARTAPQIAAAMHRTFETPPAGLTAVYDFNESSGTGVFERVGRRSGTLNGATRVASLAPVSDTFAAAPIGRSTQAGGAGASLAVNGSDAATVAVTGGTGSATVGDGLPASVSARADRVWLLNASASAARVLTIGYGSMTAVSPQQARLLHRTSQGQAWADVTGQFTHDLSAKTFTGTTMLAGQFAIGLGTPRTLGAGQALAANGTATTTSANVDLSGSFSIAFWAKRNAINRSDFFIGQGTNTPSQGLHIGFRNNSLFTFAFSGNNDLNTTAYTDTDWNHWAVTYDRATGARVIYRNGVAVASDVASGPYAGTGPLRLGGSPSHSAEGALGGLDEVQVWNRVLPPHEIRGNLTRNVPLNASGLVHYWAFDETSGSTTNDLVGGAIVQRGSVGTGASGAALSTSVAEADSTVAMGPNNLKLLATRVAASSQKVVAATSGDAGQTTTSGVPNRISLRSQFVWHAYTDVPLNLSLEATGLSGIDLSRAVVLYRPARGAAWQVSPVPFTYEATFKSFTAFNAPAGDYTIGQGLPQPTGNGQALALTGNGHAEFGYNAALNPATFTAEAWAKPTGGSGRRHIVTSRADGTNGYILYLTETGQLRFWIGQGGGNWTEAIGPVLPLGQWSHVAGTYDGTTARLYVNGALVAEQATHLVPNSSRPLRIGSDTWGTPNEQWVGEIDEVRIWNTARSASALLQTLNRTLTGDEAGLAAYYRFEGSGATVNDYASSYTGNGVNASRVASTVPFANQYAQGTSGSLSIQGASASSIAGGTVWLFSYSDPVADLTTGLPSGATERLSIVLGVQGTSGSRATVTFAVPDGIDHPRLLYRASSTQPWTDATPAFTYDEQADTFKQAGLTQFGEYVVASGTPQRIGSSMALSLEGTNSHVALGTAPTMGLTNASFTVEAWIYPDTLNGDRSLLGTTEQQTNQGLHLILRNGRPLLGFYGNDEFAVQPIPLKQWTHLAFVYDMAAQRQRIYVNGVEVITGTGHAPFAGTGTVYIGRSLSAGYFDGQIDELRIWSTARSAADVEATMRRTLAGTEAGLRHYYAFDGDRSSVLDLKGGETGLMLGNTTRRPSAAPLGQASTRLASAGSQQNVGRATGASGDAATVRLATAGTGAKLDVYAQGLPDASPIMPGTGQGANERFPATVTKRAARVWGLKPIGTGVTADVTFHYGGLAGTDGFENVRLLRRAAADQPWQDVTGEFAHDTGARTFSATGRSSFSEYTVAAAEGLRLSLKAFLQGAYDAGGGAMRTTLASGGHLDSQTSHPYGAAPFGASGTGYTGTEAIATTDANSNSRVDFYENSSTVVDWVYVQLRSGSPSSPPMTVVDEAAGLLHANGTITHADGTSPLTFTRATGGSYHVTLYHRNHLAVMSASAVDLTSGSASYDFSTSMAQAYGGAGVQAEVASGVFGLIGGDYNQDGQVTTADFTAFNNALVAGQTGYRLADVTADGQVTTTDFTPFNNALVMGAVTRVPAASAAAAASKQAPNAVPRLWRIPLSR